MANRKYNASITLKPACMFYQFESVICWMVVSFVKIYFQVHACIYKVYTCVSFTLTCCPNCFGHI